MNDNSSGEGRDIESMIPRDPKCREEMTALLHELDSKVAAQVEALATREPSIVDPTHQKIEFIKEASELAGQRMLIKGLTRILSPEAPTT